jgi:hypothetical protein
VFCNKFVDHGGRRGGASQALTRWRHPVASHEALDVFHRAMCLASYQQICIAIKIASNSTAFFVFVHFVVGHNPQP